MQERYFVESYAPELDETGLGRIVGRIRDETRAAAARGASVRHVRSYLLQGDEMCLHVFEAGSLAEVVDIAGRAGLEVERISPALSVEGDGGPPHRRAAGRSASRSTPRRLRKEHPA